MIFVLSAMVLQSISIIFIKYAAKYMPEFTFMHIIQNPYYMLSLFFLFLQALVWQFALKKIPLSKAYFFMSGVNIIVLLASYFLFKEEISASNIIGVFIILSGLAILIKVKHD